MKLYEYQAKEMFREAGITVPVSVLLDNREKTSALKELTAALEKTALPAVLKSQLLQGGRGKAGLVKIASTSGEAESVLDEFRVRGVEKVLVEQAIDIKSEIYLSIITDPESGTALIMGSSQGGVDIEQLAISNPDKIIREKVDIERGLPAFLARDIAFRLDAEAASKIAGVLLKLFDVFLKTDAEMVEINPLFITAAGDAVAGDGKLSIDDNSAFRQPAFIPGRDYYDSDAEYEAASESIPYLQFDGDISLMCAGAGLTTTVYDLINYEGGSVANYLEFGGPNYRKARRAMELCLKNDSKVILIVTFGTIARADVMAEGVAAAIAELKPDRPVVVCIRGTNEEEAFKTLRAAGLEPLFDTEEAVRKAVELAAASAEGDNS